MNPTPHTLRRTSIAVATVGLAAAVVAPAVAAPAPARNQHVALVNETDAQADQFSALNSAGQVIGSNGMEVVFSTAAALVPSDTNNTTDVYLRLVNEGITILVSANRKGEVGNDASFEPTISADGHHIAFTTWATNLTRSDKNPEIDVVVKNMQTGVTKLVSVNSKEKQRQTSSFAPLISRDGSTVAFQTFGRYSAKDTDRKEDVYVRDVAKGRTTLASISPKGKEIKTYLLLGGLSDDGTRVTFGNDTDLWWRDLETKKTKRFWHEPAKAICNGPFSAGSAGRPAISGDGKWAAFASCASKLPKEDGAEPDVWRVKLATGKLQRVHEIGNYGSWLPTLSRTGRFVAFASDASNLVAGDDEGKADVFRVDLKNKTIVRASVNAEGEGGNNHSGPNEVAISRDGHSIAYVTYATNLVPGDTVDFREALIWSDATVPGPDTRS